MQERKVVVSRTVISNKFAPIIKKSIDERVGEFVAARNEISIYPFSPDISVKALGAKKPASADNKARRQKAKSKFVRIGSAIYDPDAKQKPGQFFTMTPLPFNRDGQMGDVANVGWVDPPKEVAMENLAENYRKYLEKRRASNKPEVAIRTVNRNPRTGGFEQKSLGRTIGQAVGNIGQAAARALGIVIDADGRFRCPPGVPAANQFTDEVGSNCFDFSPIVARKLIEVAQRAGQQLRQDLSVIDSVAPTQSLASGRRAFSGRAGRVLAFLRSGGKLPEPADAPPLLGPDGKPIDSPAATIIAEAEDIKKKKRRRRLFRDAEKEAERVAESEPSIDPSTYEEVYYKYFKKFGLTNSKGEPLTDEEIKRLARVAAQRARALDETKRQQQLVLDMIKKEFPDFDLDLSNPASVTEGLTMLAFLMKERGWNCDLAVFGKLPDNPTKEQIQEAFYKLLLETNTMVVDHVVDVLRKNTIDGIDTANPLVRQELKKLGIDLDIKRVDRATGETVYGHLDSELAKKIEKGLDNGIPPSVLFPDEEQKLLRDIYGTMQVLQGQALTYFNGIMTTAVYQAAEEPGRAGLIDRIAWLDANDINFGNNAAAAVSGGKYTVFVSIGAILRGKHTLSLSDSGEKLITPVSSGGTDVAKLMAIEKVVGDETRMDLIKAYFGDLHRFSDAVALLEGKEGLGDLEGLIRNLGYQAFGQFVMFHEMYHIAQYRLYAAILQNRFGLTNEEALAMVHEVVIGGGYWDAALKEWHSLESMLDPETIAGVLEEYPEIVRQLLAQNAGGRYPMDYYWQGVYFKKLANSADPDKTISELEREADKLDREDPRRYAIGQVINWWDRNGRMHGQRGASEVAEQLSNQTLLELQADIGAAVAMNLIPRTPEIDALLAPLHDVGDDGKTLKRDLTNIIDRVAPLEMPKREDVEKVKARKLFGSLITDLTRIAVTDFDERVQEARDNGLIRSGRAEEVEQRGLSSTAMFSGRRSMSKWAGSLRESIMDSATPEQKKVIESDWRKKPWSKPATTEVVSFNLSMDIDGSRTVAMLDKELIPFADLIEKSKLPNGVAVEMLLPDGSMGVPGNNIDGARFAISHHFTGILKSEDDLGAVGIVDTNARKFSGFETSLSNEPGSRYSYNRDGKVTRKKPSTGSSITDSDTTSTFDNTVFVSQKDQEALRFAFERGRGLSEDGELIGLDYDDTTRNTAEYLRLRKEYLRSGMDAYEATDKAFVDSGGTINERVIVPETEPKIGLNVFEWDNNNGTRHHPGNKVRKITKRSEREQGVMGPTSGTQRVIVNVPEGFSGLPDFTPGTDRSEVGSIILPPGELEVVGRLSDGTVMARVTSQSNAVESLAPFESALRQISQSNRESLTQKANAQKALRKIEIRKTAARIMATRLASGRKPANSERDTTAIPDEITPSNRVIQERMKSQNITFGKRQTQQLQKKRNAYLEKIQASRRGGGMVAIDDHRFESPEEARVRVDNTIDAAFQHIKVGKLPHLSPEVSEIMQGKSKDEIKAILAEAIRKQIKGLDKRIRFRIRGESMSGIKDSRESPLMGFIKRGRYMTTHQDTGSQASSLAENRIESELLLGIPETADDSLRPAHGYMLHVDEVEFIKRAKKDRASKMKPQDGDEVDIDVLMPTPGGAFGSVNTFEGKVVDSLAFQYGSSEIVLKPEIAQRAVLTFGDSFNGMRTPVGFDGSETDDELLEAALLQRAGALGGGLFSNSSLDTQQRRIANLLEASVADNYAHVTDVSTPGYAGAVGSEQRYYNEGIVAGGFGMDDVEEIRIDEGFQRQHMREHKVSPKTVDGNTIREYFGPYVTKQDAELIVEILENKDKKYSAAMVSDLREQIAFRAEAIGKLRERQRIRTLIAENLKDPQNMPKVTFLRYDGVNDDVHSFYPRSVEISDMTEEHELVDVVGYGSVKIIREFLSKWGARVAPEVEMDALKPRKSSDKLGSPKRLASGRGQVARREPSRIDRRIEAIRDNAETLLGELGQRVKSGKQSLDNRAVPQPSASRSMFPFIIDKEEK